LDRERIGGRRGESGCTPTRQGNPETRPVVLVIPGELGDVNATHLVKTGTRALITAALLVFLYFVLPIEHRPHQSIVLRLTVALVLFVVVLGNEIRLISGHERPILRASVAMATIIPLFLVSFAWIYLTMARAYPAAFGVRLDRISALYFTVSVFSTVGFGDITPKTDMARLVVTVQMLADLAVVAIVIRLILGAAARGVNRLRGSTTS
jgi:voltage-gated potassium channel